MTLSARDLLIPNVLRVPAEARPADYYRETVGSPPLVFAVFERETFLGLIDAQAVAHYPQRIFLDLCHLNSPEPIADTTLPAQILAAMECQQRDALPVVNADGHFLGVVTRGRVTDAFLTQSRVRHLREHKRAAQQLWFQNSLLEHVPMGIVATDLAGRIIYWNREAERLYQWTAAEALGQHIATLKLSDDPQERRDQVITMLKATSFWEGEYLGRRKDGSTFPAYVIDTAIRDAQGQQLGFVGLNTDITARKQAEGTMLQLSQALEQTADSVIITDRDGVITYVNAAFERLTGYTPAEAVGHTSRLLKSDQHDARFYQDLWRTLLGGEVFRTVFTNRKKDGELYYEEKTLTPLRDQTGHVTHFVSTGRDITVRQRLEEEAEQRRREAEVMAALAHSLNASLELDAILPRVAEGAKDLCRGAAASIALREPGGNAAVVRYRVGEGSELFKDLCIDPGDGLGGQVLRTGRPARTEQYATDPRPSPDLLRIVHEAGTVTTLVVPIVIDERVEGLLYVSRGSPKPFTDHDEEILQRLADHAAVAIRNARLYAEAQQRRWVAESLAEVNYLLLQSLDPVEVGQWIVDSLRRLLRVQAAALYRLDPESDALVALATAGDISLEQGQSLVFPRGTGLSWLAVQQREPMAIPDILADPRVTLTHAQRARLDQVTYRAVLAVPMQIEARVIGTLTVADHLGRSYDQEAIGLAQAFADQGATALHNAQLYAEVQDSRARLEALSRQLLEVQESERRRIARELHDEIGQILTGVKLQLAAGQRLRDPQFLRHSFDTSLALVEQAQQQVRALALELRPSTLDDLGLLPALRWYTDQQAQRGGFQAQVSVAPPALRVPPHLETACFRIVQEALTNVLRHAQARQVHVEVRQHETELTLYIQDDGVGFEVAAAQARARQGESLGILGMQERAELAGGHLEIVSSPGDGTSIRVCFPHPSTASTCI